MRDNETTTLVFSDAGNEYAGCGEYDEAFFKTRPSGETKKQHMVNNFQEKLRRFPLERTS